jgi:hypothetical protein
MLFGALLVLTLRKKSYGSKQQNTTEKVQDFKNQFRPFLLNMTLWTMHRFFGTDCGKSHWRGITHVLMVKLKEAPPNSPCGMMIEGKDIDEMRNLESKKKFWYKDPVISVLHKMMPRLI